MDENKWFEDERGNRCSTNYFGDEEAAKAALASLIDCDNCTNCTNCSDCSDCSDCSGCSRCSDCSDCSRCSRCSRCSGCSGCSDCSDCSDCSGCSRCSDCSGCSDCSDCSDCSGCSRCSDCSDCSGCSDCSDCSDCSNVAYLIDKKNLSGDPSVTDAPGVPPVPVIEDIHRKVYAAVSQPDALNMGDWHSCNTTHCRGGWVVHLAGEAGYALERFHGPLLTAQLIYKASGYEINPCRFFDDNDDAMADMKKLAGAEE